MILKTIQPLHILAQINSDTNTIIAPKYEEDNDLGFTLAFDWLKNEMKKRNLSVPQQEMFWAWEYSTRQNKRICQEVIKSQINYCEENGGGVIITLNKPDNEVLLSDYELWHYPLNYWRIPQSEEDEKVWDKLIEQEDYNFYKHKPLTKNSEMVTDTWSAALALVKHCSKNHYVFNLSKKQLKVIGISKKQTQIQATFWSFKKEEIVDLEIIKA